MTIPAEQSTQAAADAKYLGAQARQVELVHLRQFGLHMMHLEALVK